jgi:periplasmic divalent cation tolerance protein
MPQEVVVWVTCPAAKAEAIASGLVEEGLAACVNILPGITSIFRWQGKICRDQETLLFIKTNRNLWDRLEKRIRELHSYEVPEIICLPIDGGHQPYLDWLNSSIKLSPCKSD